MFFLVFLAFGMCTNPVLSDFIVGQGKFQYVLLEEGKYDLNITSESFNSTILKIEAMVSVTEEKHLQLEFINKEGKRIITNQFNAFSLILDNSNEEVLENSFFGNNETAASSLVLTVLSTCKIRTISSKLIPAQMSDSLIIKNLYSLYVFMQIDSALTELIIKLKTENNIYVSLTRLNTLQGVNDDQTLSFDLSIKDEVSITHTFSKPRENNTVLYYFNINIDEEEESSRKQIQDFQFSITFEKQTNAYLFYSIIFYPLLCLVILFFIGSIIGFFVFFLKIFSRMKNQRKGFFKDNFKKDTKKELKMLPKRLLENDEIIDNEYEEEFEQSEESEDDKINAEKIIEIEGSSSSIDEDFSGTEDVINHTQFAIINDKLDITPKDFDDTQKDYKFIKDNRISIDKISKREKI